jgi:glycosyltransferase involved in cell wall biosynthesis
VGRGSVGRRLRVAYVYRHYRRAGSIPTLYVDMVDRLAQDVAVTAVCASRTRAGSPNRVSFIDVEPLICSSSRLGYAVECWTFARRAARTTSAHRKLFDVVHVEGFASTWADLVTVHAVRAAEVDHYFREVEPHARVRRHLSARLFRPQTAAVLSIERRLLRRSQSMFICPTSAVAADLVKYHGVASDTITVIPYGIDLPRFSNDPAASSTLRHEVSTPQDRIVMLMVASDFERKGVDRAIDTLARVHVDGEIWVVGGDDPRPYVRRAASAGIADRVRFLGGRPAEELPTWYAASDILLAPSYQDSWALPVIEAMAAGCVVIASSHSGSSRAIEHARSGFVVEGAGDPAEIAALIDGPLANRELRSRISENARRAVRPFDNEALYPQHLDAHYRAYERRLARQSTPRGAASRERRRSAERRSPVA